MSKRVSLVQIAKEQLFSLIRKLPENSRRLPSEEELCQQLDISRATLREALAQLSRGGFITKRHGIGNLVNHSVLNTPMRFDEELSMRRLLNSSGKQCHTERFVPVSASAEQTDFLKRVTSGRISLAEPWLIQESRHTITGKPVVWTFNLYSNEGKHLSEKDIHGLSFRELVVAVTGKELSHTIKAFIPIAAGVRLAEFFSIAPQTPLLMWHLKNFDQEDVLLSEGVSIFNPEEITLHSFNRWD